MTAFVTAAASSQLRASAFAFTWTTPAACAPRQPTSRTTHLSRSRATHLPRRPPTHIPTTAQYNYNIYQDNEDRSRRVVTETDRAVTIAKPLGLVLEEGQDGMVFVAEIDPNGNAAEEDTIKEGDVVVAVSATFGDDVWSTRGVGLDRVMKSIRVRAGGFVTLVLETPKEISDRKTLSAAEAEARRTMARETRGEREVVNPVTWSAAKTPNQPLYDDGEPDQAVINEKLKEKLKQEVAAPYEQNWILWISGGIFLLVILSVIAGIS